MRTIILAVPIFLCGYVAVAQDIDLGEVPLDGEVFFLESASSGSGEVISSTTASISFAPSVDLMPIGSGAKNGDFELMHLLRNQSIRDEIELVESQYEKMRKRNEQIQAELKELSQSLMKAKDGAFKFDSEALKKIVERQAEFQKNAKADLEEMLLPHQIKRLRQVALQDQMNRFGTAEALSTGVLAEALELTDEQKESLKEKSKEIEERVRKEIAKIRAEAKQELYKVLDAKQQDKLSELVGDHFEKVNPRRAKLQELLSRRLNSKSKHKSADRGEE